MLAGPGEGPSGRETARSSSQEAYSGPSGALGNATTSPWSVTLSGGAVLGKQSRLNGDPGIQGLDWLAAHQLQTPQNTLSAGLGPREENRVRRKSFLEDEIWQLAPNCSTPSRIARSIHMGDSFVGKLGSE